MNKLTFDLGDPTFYGKVASNSTGTTKLTLIGHPNHNTELAKLMIKHDVEIISRPSKEEEVKQSFIQEDIPFITKNPYGLELTKTMSKSPLTRAERRRKKRRNKHTKMKDYNGKEINEGDKLTFDWFGDEDIVSQMRSWFPIHFKDKTDQQVINRAHEPYYIAKKKNGKWYGEGIEVNINGNKLYAHEYRLKYTKVIG